MPVDQDLNAAMAEAQREIDVALAKLEAATGRAVVGLSINETRCHYIGDPTPVVLRGVAIELSPRPGAGWGRAT